mmetsp:Transcript_69579/g.166909  ORF Transcript_69579/g.166909 Transcript_69579/m.166909 type:complete len:91 (+) Transcript_69579:165-437(+)
MLVCFDGVALFELEAGANVESPAVIVMRLEVDTRAPLAVTGTCARGADADELVDFNGCIAMAWECLGFPLQVRALCRAVSLSPTLDTSSE